MNLIDKDAILAEIERRVIVYQKNFEKADNKIARLSIDGRLAGLKSLSNFINTLEVEEVDLEKEIKVLQKTFFTRLSMKINLKITFGMM